jgi:acyl-CoA synthetase (AMP-forming)/AMP-acid ligase II
MSCTVGPALPCVSLRLEAVPEMNYDPAAAPPRGEVCIAGPSLFCGYYKDEAKTAEARARPAAPPATSALAGARSGVRARDAALSEGTRARTLRRARAARVLSKGYRLWVAARQPQGQGLSAASLSAAP